jgi:hypothetical protein
MCTGSLTAAAISCCRTLSELLPVSVQVISISFRAGLLAADVRARFGSSGEDDMGWAFMCPNLSADAAYMTIENFSEAQVCF